MSVPAARDPSERIALTLGRDFRGQLVPAQGRREGVTLAGFVSRPEFTRSNAAHIYVYVNGRFVKDYLLNHAVMTAYRRIIEPRRYPAAVLFLEVPAGELDVNVHPTKMEVRFRDPRGIYALIVEALSGAIGAGNTVAGRGAASPEAASGYVVRVEEALKRYRISAGPDKLLFGREPERRGAPEGPSLPIVDVVREDEPPAEKERLSDLVYLGQAAGTYLVFAAEAGIVLIDQHAAHERILFEQLKKQAAERQGKPPGQSLLLPEVISLPPRDLSFLIESIPILAEAGMEVEPFGGDSVVVKAVPALLSGAEARTLIGDLIGECMDGNTGLPLAERRERIFTALACRAAVKANRRLSGPEVERLCSDLDALPGAATCPHGRPLTIVISGEELEKRFKRR